MALASLAFNPLGAVRTILRADADVYALTEGRVVVPELNRQSPDQKPQDMPRPYVVLKNTGGGSLGPGARSRVPWTVTRLDIESYGKTTEECYQLHWAVYRVLTALGELPVEAGGTGASLPPDEPGQNTLANTRVFDAVVTGGPINERDSDTGWPFVLGVFDLSAAYKI